MGGGYVIRRPASAGRSPRARPKYRAGRDPDAVQRVVGLDAYRERAASIWRDTFYAAHCRSLAAIVGLRGAYPRTGYPSIKQRSCGRALYVSPRP